MRYQRFPIQKCTLPFLVLALGLPAINGCAGEPEQDGENDSFFDESGDAKGDLPGLFVEEQSWAAECVLNLVNSEPDKLEKLLEEAGVVSLPLGRIIERRKSGPFQTLGQLDEVSFVGTHSFLSILSHARSEFRANGSYCPGLGEEYPPPGEDKAIADTIDVVSKRMRKLFEEQGHSMRDAHAKGHGCVKAFFDVDNESLPESLRVGLFAENRRYGAWIRYSNGSPTINADKKLDSRGMGIKVMGVPGTKVLPDERFESSTQDFVFGNFPTFFARNALDYLELSTAAVDNRPLNFFLDLIDTAIDELNLSRIRLREFMVAIGNQTRKVPNILFHRFWSLSPFRHCADGDSDCRTAVKYSAIPCENRDLNIPKGAADDYIQDEMARTLDKEEACYLFGIQVQTDPEAMPIEDVSVEWDEEKSPFLVAGTITIPIQDFSSPEQAAFCENLHYTAWHSLPAHKPLGGINRLRGAVYETMSQARHHNNGAETSEPTCQNGCKGLNDFVVTP